jgi:hypothetical protein
MDFRQYIEAQGLPDNYAKDLDFMNLTNSLRELMAQLFGKTHITRRALSHD